jgi:hypothetical protein
MTDILKNTDSEQSLRPGGMSFKEIFGLEKQPISFTAAKWIEVFTDNVAAVLRARNIPRIEAERVAFTNTVTAFLDANHSNSDPTRCAHCGSSERPNDLRPMGGGTCHSWVHGDCWEEWRERRRAEAIAALAALEIVPP